MITERKEPTMKANNSILRKGVIATVFLVLLSSVFNSAIAADADFTSLATLKRGLSYPVDVAVSASGKIYVSDGLNNKVFIYDSSYRLTGSIDTVKKPGAVAVSSNGTIYVADNKSRSVKILNGAGETTGFLQDVNGDMVIFNMPRSIAVDSTGTVFVVDQFEDSIEVFDAAGTYLYTIGSLNLPQDAVVVGSELFIIDQPLKDTDTTTGASGSSSLHVSRVQIFNLIGKSFVTDPARAFSAYGTDKSLGQYISLKGLGVDPHDTLYLIDSYLNIVYKYSTDGDFLGAIDDSLQTPLGATVSVDGQLFVTSSFEGTVKSIGVDYLAGADTWGNESPVAVAGADQNVAEGDGFILDGSGSADADGIQSYRWTQTNGAPVLAGNPFVTEIAQVNLTAPNVGPEGGILTFELVVTDSKGKESTAATTKVTVNNVLSGSLVINSGAMYTNSHLVSLSLDAPEAVEMRFANDSEAFSGAYYSYTAAGQWTLSDGDGNKTVNVEFKDVGGNLTNSSSSIILDTVEPGSPELINADAQGGEFNWQPAADAVSYTFQFASNSQFTGAETISGLDYNGMTMALDGFVSGLWYWRVQSVDVAGNTSDWSATGTFRVGPNCTLSPDTPQLALPYYGAEDVFRTVLLETDDMTYPAECGEHLRTEWQISERPDFGSLVMHVGTTMDNLTSFQVPALVLEAATTYYWRVKQLATNGEASAWSEGWSFTTIADYDQKGEGGILYVQPEGEPADASGEEIVIKETVGDAGIRIKAIRVSSGVVTKTIQDIDPHSIPDTVNKPSGFPLGLLSIKLDVLEPGAFVQVKVLFSSAAPDGAQWYSYNTESGWHAYEGAVFSRNRKSVTLNFQDGGLGDTDGVVNGIIVNP
jgi:sugar lactone lactonase YvrE